MDNLLLLLATAAVLLNFGEAGRNGVDVINDARSELAKKLVKRQSDDTLSIEEVKETVKEAIQETECRAADTDKIKEIVKVALESVKGDKCKGKNAAAAAIAVEAKPAEPETNRMQTSDSEAKTEEERENEAELHEKLERMKINDQVKQHVAQKNLSLEDEKKKMEQEIRKQVQKTEEEKNKEIEEAKKKLEEEAQNRDDAREKEVKEKKKQLEAEVEKQEEAKAKEVELANKKVEEVARQAKEAEEAKKALEEQVRLANEKLESEIAEKEEECKKRAEKELEIEAKTKAKIDEEVEKAKNEMKEECRKQSQAHAEVSPPLKKVKELKKLLPAKPKSPKCKVKGPDLHIQENNKIWDKLKCLTAECPDVSSKLNVESPVTPVDPKASEVTSPCDTKVITGDNPPEGVNTETEPIITTSEDPEVLRLALNKHNEYRDTHKVPHLQFDEDLQTGAESWARSLASAGELKQADSKGSFGENLYRECRPGKMGDPMVMVKAIDKWYSRVCNFNFADQKDMTNVLDFVKMVWRSSTKLGMGKAIRRMADGTECSYVVARYSPRGTYNSEDWQQNFEKGTFDKTKVCQGCNLLRGEGGDTEEEKSCDVETVI